MSGVPAPGRLRYGRLLLSLFTLAGFLLAGPGPSLAELGHHLLDQDGPRHGSEVHYEGAGQSSHDDGCDLATVSPGGPPVLPGQPGLPPAPLAARRPPTPPLAPALAEAHGVTLPRAPPART